LLPPLKTFIEEKPNELLAIRNDLGLAYLYTVREWYRNPNEDNKESVKILLRQYCDQICKRYQNITPVNLIASLNTDSNVIFNSGFDAVVSVINTAIPLVGRFLTVAKLGFTFYKYFSNRSQRKIQKKEIELTLPFKNL